MGAEHAVKESKTQSTRSEHAVTSEESIQAESPAPSLDLTPANVVKLQHMIGNQAVQRLIAQNRQSPERPKTTPAFQNAEPDESEALPVALAQPAASAEKIQRFPSWSDIKEAGYKTLISGAVAFRQTVIAIIRTQANQLPENLRGPAMTIVDYFNDVLQVLFNFIFYMVGVVVGIGEGVVDLVVGLAKLAMSVLQYMLEIMQALMGDPQYFKAHFEETKQVFLNFIPGLKALFEKWKEDFANAPQERQAAMIGELVGQIIAFIGTAEVGGAKLGRLGKGEKGMAAAESAETLAAKAGGSGESAAGKAAETAKWAALRETRLKQMVIDSWSKGGSNRLVKVVPGKNGAKYLDGGSIRGYVTQEKFIVGRTPEEIERILGLKNGTLKEGADVIWIDEIPKADQFDFVVPQGRPPGTPAGYSNVPGLPDYPPGLGAPQWILKDSKPGGMQSVGVGGKYLPK